MYRLLPIFATLSCAPQGSHAQPESGHSLHGSRIGAPVHKADVDGRLSGCVCRRMFESAVAVGVYHKSENKLSINPKEDVVFGPGDQVVALSNSGKTTLCAVSLLTMVKGLRLLFGLALACTSFLSI